MGSRAIPESPSESALTATPMYTTAASRSRARLATPREAGKKSRWWAWTRTSITRKRNIPLLGKHATVDCGACHKGGDFKKEIPFAKCTDCHLDAHNGQFAKRPKGIQCEACHTVDTFKPSTFLAKDHDTPTTR